MECEAWAHERRCHQQELASLEAQVVSGAVFSILNACRMSEPDMPAWQRPPAARQRLVCKGVWRRSWELPGCVRRVLLRAFSQEVWEECSAM